LNPIPFIDRATGKKCDERVYGGKALQLLYGDDLVSKILSPPLLHLLCRYPLFSHLYGSWQKSAKSKAKIKPFIKEFELDSSEYLLDVDAYTSFNDFFIRKLKPEARPIVAEDNIAIIPADARYLFHQNIQESDGFIVKGEKFCLSILLGDLELAKKYEGGSMVMARLCPVDYHRYHFPCDSVPKETRFINGWLYSVNPIALKKNIHVLTQNKRAITELETQAFGTVQYLEIGATSVGSINQTYTPNEPYKKGDELGYFSFGASFLILLFEKGRIQIDQDLLEATAKGTEMRCLLGQSLGTGANL